MVTFVIDMVPSEATIAIEVEVLDCATVMAPTIPTYLPMIFDMTEPVSEHYLPGFVTKQQVDFAHLKCDRLEIAFDETDQKVDFATVSFITYERHLEIWDDL